MDFQNRNVQPSAAGRPAPAASSSASAHGGDHGRPKSGDSDESRNPKWLKIVWVTLLFAATILLVSVAALLFFGDSRKESRFIEEDKIQAVFLNNGQVYFGDLVSVNDKYLDMRGIFYLSVDQPVQPEQEGQQQGNITLQKLGCELHGPADQMIINREHVTFWENLKMDGQVSEAVAQWIEQNPNGLENCDAPAQQENNEEATNEENGQNETQ